MGQITEKSSSAKMAKSSSAVKKSSVTRGKGKVQGSSISLSDPKVQSILLVGVLVVLALAFFIALKKTCRRRRRRSSCRYCVNNTAKLTSSSAIKKFTSNLKKKIF